MSLDFLISPQGSMSALLIVWWLGLALVAGVQIFSGEFSAKNFFLHSVELAAVLILVWILLQIVIHGIYWGF